MSIDTDINTIIYPDSDGEPMADNSKQFRWIITIEGGLEDMFRHDPNVYVIGDMFWYPVEGRNDLRAAPDAMVIFGRPKRDRGSYQQWNEDNIAPQVVFEILSPGNKPREMAEKRDFYEQYGVEEYYIYNPENPRLEGWIRRGQWLVQINSMQNWVSPRLNVRFALDLSDYGRELKMYDPEGRPFETFLVVRERLREAEIQAGLERARALQAELEREQAMQEREQERQRAELAEQEREQERQRAEQALQQIEQERQRAAQAEQEREQERLRAERLAARLKALGLSEDDEN